MRYIMYGAAILAAMLVVTIATSHLPRAATASIDETNGTVDVFKLEQTIDAKTLPQQEISDEAYRLRQQNRVLVEPGGVEPPTS